MTFTRWEGKPKAADPRKPTDTKHGVSPLPPGELRARLTAAGWTHLTLTVNGKPQ
jgi:hypothetical protein